MNKIKNCILLIMTVLSIIVGMTINSQANEGIWTGCIDSHRGFFYDLQPDTYPMSPCRTLDYNIGFYDRDYVNNLTYQIDNSTVRINELTNQINILTVQMTNMSDSINYISNKLIELSLNVNKSSNLFKNQTDVTSYRIKNTVYQNVLETPILVSVSCYCDGTVGYTAILRAHVENVTPPTINVAEAGLFNNPSSVREITQISFVVPPGFYYSVDSDASTGNIAGFTHWLEWS